jgi:hypothetical protein
VGAVNAVRTPWSSASFLLYAGGIVILTSMAALLIVLGDDYGDPAFVGWSALVFAVLGGLAFGARAAGRRVSAGLFALSAVVALTVFVGALEVWFGWLGDTGSGSPFSGFHLDHFLIELTLLVGALVGVRIFHFPLLLLLATVAAWFFVTDFLSNGGNWSTTVTLVFGLVAMLVGVAQDRVYGFWVHVVAGLTIGGALLEFWHTSTFEWILIGIVSLAFLLVGSGLERSSYAVLAAIGLFLTTTYFVGKWFLSPSDLVFPADGTGGNNDPWAAALSYGVYGFALMLIGLWLARRRTSAEPL